MRSCENAQTIFRFCVPASFVVSRQKCRTDEEASKRGTWAEFRRFRFDEVFPIAGEGQSQTPDKAGLCMIAAIPYHAC